MNRTELRQSVFSEGAITNLISYPRWETTLIGSRTQMYMTKDEHTGVTHSFR